MATKPTIAVSSANSQRDQRTAESVFDQHKNVRFPNGRPWWGYTEIQTDRRAFPAFVCELMPGDVNDPMESGWNAPWFPTQMRESSGRRYLELNMKKSALTWNYGLMIADNKLATANHYRAAAKMANANGWKAPGLNEPLSFQLETLLGPPPLSYRIPEAAMAGDPWLLGFTEQVNQDLADLLTGVTVYTGEGVVKVADVLKLGEGDDALDAKIAKAVALALAQADDERKRQQSEKIKAGMAKKSGKKANSGTHARTVAVG